MWWALQDHESEVALPAQPVSRTTQLHTSHQFWLHPMDFCTHCHLPPMLLPLPSLFFLFLVHLHIKRWHL